MSLKKTLWPGLTKTVEREDFGGDTRLVVVPDPRGIALAVVYVVLLGLLVVPTVFGVYTVDPGEKAVKFNRFTGEYEVVDEGIHWRHRLAAKVWVYDVRDRIDTASAASASHDLQVVDTTITVRYRPVVSELVDLHRSIGTDYLDKVIRPAVQESVKACTAQFTYTGMVQDRPLVKLCVEEIVSERLAREGIHTSTVDIVDFQPPEELTLAITQKEAAHQEALRQQNLLEASRAQAQQDIARAEGRAEAARLIAEIPDSSSYLYLQWLERWDGRLPQVLAGEDTQMILPVPGRDGTQ